MVADIMAIVVEAGHTFIELFDFVVHLILLLAELIGRLGMRAALFLHQPQVRVLLTDLGPQLCCPIPHLYLGYLLLMLQLSQLRKKKIAS